MKKISILLLFLFSFILTFCQYYPPLGSPTGNTIIRGFFIKGLYIPIVSDTTVGFTTGGVDSLGAIIQIRSTGILYHRDTIPSGGHFWNGIGGVTLVQLNDSLSNYVKIQSQSPTSTITTSPLQYGLTAATTQNITLAWSAGRLGGGTNVNPTATLLSIIIGGVPQSFMQPSAPGTVSGNQSLTINTNTNQTFSNVVTTTDGKTTTSNVTVSYLPYIYYGWVDDSTGIEDGSYDPTIQALTNNLSTSKSLSFSPGAATNKYLIIAYPSSEGNLSSITIGGIGSIGSFRHITRSFTNQLGNVQSYIIYINTQAQTTDGNGYNVITQ